MPEAAPAKREPRARYTLDEWHAEAVRRFGTNPRDWKFVCPGCGHVQSFGDFLRLRDEGRGPDPETVYFSCIGRWEGQRRDWLNGTGPGPCNYSSGGLFKLAPAEVLGPDGKYYPVFAFAEAS
jgi:hypothetical protein